MCPPSEWRLFVRNIPLFRILPTFVGRSCASNYLASWKISGGEPSLRSTAELQPRLTPAPSSADSSPSSRPAHWVDVDSNQCNLCLEHGHTNAPSTFGTLTAPHRTDIIQMAYIVRGSLAKRAWTKCSQFCDQLTTRSSHLSGYSLMRNSSSNAKRKSVSVGTSRII